MRGNSFVTGGGFGKRKRKNNVGDEEEQECNQKECKKRTTGQQKSKEAIKIVMKLHADIKQFVCLPEQKAARDRLERNVVDSALQFKKVRVNLKTEDFKNKFQLTKRHIILSVSKSKSV